MRKERQRQEAAVGVRSALARGISRMQALYCLQGLGCCGASRGGRTITRQETDKMQNAYYPRLLAPIQVGAHALRNRVVMGSLHTRLENEPDAVTRLAAFYGARARGEVGLVITGGTAPNFAGRVEDGAQVLDRDEKLAEHIPIVQAVHAGGAKIALQVLHTGIYAKHNEIVGPTAMRSPINPRLARELSSDEIEQTIEDYAVCAALAQRAGYDGIEIMGSEGYLITQFTASRTNKRTDDWGGSFENRIRFPVEVVRRVRQRVGPGFMLLYRISAIDLVEGGLTGEEINRLAVEIEKAGIDAFNTGIGWHESTVPTIATSVPRGAFVFAAARIRKVVAVPVIASNRINMPDLAEQIVASGQADMVSLARPFLADPDFVAKAASGRSDEINTCIACNQACLDMIFTNRVATCLVNPKACHETEFPDTPPRALRRIAVIGSGPAGLACATTAAERGHRVDLFEAGDQIGGQLDLARRIPGKEQEFSELLRYFDKRLKTSGVQVHLGVTAEAGQLAAAGYDHIVVATGIRPRRPDFPGVNHPKVVRYLDVILGRVVVGERVAIIGTGGIAYDVAELLTEAGQGPQDAKEFLAQWGVDPAITEPGGLTRPQPGSHRRDVTLLQRSHAKPGSRLGKSTGWIHRATLAGRGVKTISGCTYELVDEQGLHYTADGQRRVLQADTVILCAGQDPDDRLADALATRGVTAGLIGGARLASELDAMRAIDEGTRLAWSIG